MPEPTQQNAVQQWLMNLLAEWFSSQQGNQSPLVQGLSSLMPTPDPQAPGLGQALMQNAQQAFGSAPTAAAPRPTAAATPRATGAAMPADWRERMQSAEMQKKLAALMAKRAAAGRGMMR